jgi:AcrR family transcriptional regulator
VRMAETYSMDLLRRLELALSEKRSKGAPDPPALRRFEQERARLTYEKLLACGLVLFRDRGYLVTQAPDIAHAADVSVGAFYRYFESKLALFIEAAHIALEINRVDQAAGLVRWRKKIESGEADGRAFLEAVISWAAANQYEGSDLMRTFVALSYQDEKVAALRRAYDESDRRDLARFFAAVTSRDRIPSPIATARVWDLAAEEILRWASFQDKRIAAETRSTLVDMFDRYLFA